MRALLQQALDALTNAQDALDNNQVTLEARQLTGFSKTCHGANSIALELGYDAIQALRTELAKPEPEPVAWMLGHRLYGKLNEATYDWNNDSAFDNIRYVPVPLFTKEQL